MVVVVCVSDAGRKSCACVVDGAARSPAMGAVVSVVGCGLCIYIYRHIYIYMHARKYMSEFAR